MPYDIVTGIFIAATTLLLLASRTNSAVVFFSISAGSMMSSQLGDDALLIGSALIKNSDINRSVALMILLIVPVILSSLFLRASISPSKFLLNILPSASAASLVLLLAVPLLPTSINSEFMSSDIWVLLQKLQPAILVVGMVSSIVLLWFTGPRGKKSKARKSK